jgi:hypothetical protein
MRISYLRLTARALHWERGRPRPQVAAGCKLSVIRFTFVRRTRAGEGARAPSEELEWSSESRCYFARGHSILPKVQCTRCGGGSSLSFLVCVALVVVRAVITLVVVVIMRLQVDVVEDDAENLRADVLK